jgi:hypothetical protein
VNPTKPAPESSIPPIADGLPRDSAEGALAAIARLHPDISLADFEAMVGDFASCVRGLRVNRGDLEELAYFADLGARRLYEIHVAEDEDGRAPLFAELMAVAQVLGRADGQLLAQVRERGATPDLLARAKHLLEPHDNLADEPVSALPQTARCGQRLRRPARGRSRAARTAPSRSRGSRRIASRSAGGGGPGPEPSEPEPPTRWLHPTTNGHRFARPAAELRRAAA